MVYLPPTELAEADLDVLTGTPQSSIDLDGAEIVSYYASAQVALVITGGNKLKVVDYSGGFNTDPVEALTLALPGNAQSVAINEDGLVAVAVADSDNGNAGSVLFYEIEGTGADV